MARPVPRGQMISMNIFQVHSDGIHLLDSMLSLSVVVVLLLIGALALRDAAGLLPGRLLATLAFCLASLGVTGLSAAEALPGTLLIVLSAISVANVALFWWTCLALLRDRFQIGRLEWLGFALFSLFPLIYFLEGRGVTIPLWPQVNLVGGFVPFLMIGHVVWVALSGLRVDLVEPRRRARVLLVLALVLAGLVSLVTEYLTDPIAASLVRNAFSLPVALGVFFWLTSLRPDRLTFESRSSATAEIPKIDPRDLALHAKLISAMEDDELFVEHRLSITDLATRLGAPEHRLRALINGGMGYRNFTAFLGEYRLIRAKALLAEPERARDTILRIALDSGFSSLQTFNRVFKDAEGVTPSAFRNEALARKL